MSDAKKRNSLKLPVLNEAPRGWPFRVCATLFQVSARLQHRLGRSLAARGVSLAQFDVLATLFHSEGITQQELAERLLVTKGNIVGLIDRVSAAGWMERRPDPEDRRINRLHLTEAGRTLVREVIPLHRAELEGAFRHFDEKELRQMQQFLEDVEVEP